MPFDKSTAKALGKKGGSVKSGGVQEYLEYIATGAARHYYSYLEKQLQGEDLPKPVKEGMDRFERNTEFVAPKLARTENKTEIEGDINFTWKQ